MRRAGMAASVVAALAATLLPAIPCGAGGGFVVIVNQANPLDRYGRADLSRLFLGRTSAWPKGAPATPCDLSGTSPIRRAFSEGVHGKPAWVIAAFWQQEIASGRRWRNRTAPSPQRRDGGRRPARRDRWPAAGNSLVRWRPSPSW